MPTSERDVQPPRAVSMRDLLAAGAAADAVSTPPVAPRPRGVAPTPCEGTGANTKRA
ncbi:hypothetical protein ABT025_30625 [Streptomyces sp. NPDC002809]|uniref:hypothetical protein n=1 Tax=Streptomyces sp. NPDC002809 TaxID=3154433 RepID=UPI003334035D